MQRHHPASPRRSGRRTCARGIIAGWLMVAAGMSVAACRGGDVMALQPAVDVGASTASIPAAVTPVAPAGPPPSISTVAYPRFDPMPQQFQPMPADEIACRNDLKKLGVNFRDLDPIAEGGACRIDHPVRISAIGSVRLQPAATVTCAMARAFAQWTKEELVPAARLRYLSGVKTIHQGSSYSCRNIRGTRTASEHSKGNAIDVMRIELNNDKAIKVKRPGLFAFRQRSLLNNVRADACGHFSTVLGPGYDRDHKDHFHFDIKHRRNGHVACR